MASIQPNFPTYKHEFIDSNKPTVDARLYPIEYLPKFRAYFNNVWLPTKAPQYFSERIPEALPHVDQIGKLPEP